MFLPGDGRVENGHLMIDGFDTVSLAEQYGTPLYVLDEDQVYERLCLYGKAMKECFSPDSYPVYASKALSFAQIYQLTNEAGAGTDVVSEGELYTALKAGFPPEKIYFHGNNKTRRAVAYALSENVGHIICDNLTELSLIEEEAAKAQKVQKILLRVTPGVDPHTLAAISTGKIDSKFGMSVDTGQAEEITRKALKSAWIQLDGFHFHLGSQVFDFDQYGLALEKTFAFMGEMKQKYGYTAKLLDIGGGFGVPYVETDPVIDYAREIRKLGDAVKRFASQYDVPQPDILMEPGRSIVADAGVTLYTVGSIKEIPGYKNYVAIDGGMTDNPRYALYRSAYSFMIANRAAEKADYKCTIAGCCCESGDILCEETSIAHPQTGDILCVFTTGAYNYSMSSNYNKVLKPALVALRNGKSFVAVKRQTLEQLMENEVL